MNIVVAVNSDWGIGQDGKQTIVIPADRRRFREITDGGVVIAGRKTFEEVSKPLPNRRNIVLTQDKDYKIEGVETANSVDEILTLIKDVPTHKVFIIGGGEIYKTFLPMCTRAYVTKIEATPSSDTFFPNLDEMPEWTPGNREFGMWYGKTDSGENTGIRYTFNVYINEAG